MADKVLVIYLRPLVGAFSRLRPEFGCSKQHDCDIAASRTKRVCIRRLARQGRQCHWATDALSQDGGSWRSRLPIAA